MKQFVSAVDAYLYCYDNGPLFPENWYVTNNFSWNEVFKNEIKADGYPILEVFKNAEKTARVLQMARTKIGRAFNIHCWVRQIPHNKRAGSTAKRSPHINGCAVDFDITGLSPEQGRARILALDLPLRIEDGTPTWIHVDTGNEYIGAFKYGLFKP